MAVATAIASKAMDTVSVHSPMVSRRWESGSGDVPVLGRLASGLLTRRQSSTTDLPEPVEPGLAALRRTSLECPA